jgi:hypothetical protein
MSDFIVCGQLNDVEITRYLGSTVSVLNSFIPAINYIGLVKVLNRPHDASFHGYE